MSKRPRAARPGISKIALILSFLCGVLVGVGSLFLYSVLDQVEDDRLPEIEDAFETDADAIVQIASEAQVIAKRKELIKFIWGEAGFPDSELPDKVEEGTRDERYAGLNNLKQINRIYIPMEWGIDSIVYHFIPLAGNNELVIYHQGHRGDFIHGLDTISALLDRGYAVIGMSMPLLGLNNQPVVHLERFGWLKITSHEQLKFLEMDAGHPIKFFLHPVAVVLNYAQQYGYDSLHMVGLSGGGWTTTLYAAIDTRISHSYPVAGSLPIYLRSESSEDWGDYEQNVPELYKIANYLELYVLGSYGKGRKQLQILNKYDPCCFAGTKYRTYEKATRDKVYALGKGAFQVYLDDSHREHQISRQAIEVIIDDLERKRKSIRAQ